MVLPLERVTAAEIVVLRAVHGDDAVIKIKHIGERNVPDSIELARLAKKFEGHKIEGGGHIVSVCFPGAAPILPQEVPARQRSIEQKAAEDAKTLTKTELEAEDVLLKEPVALDASDEDDEQPDFDDLPAADPDDDVLIDDKAA